MPCVRRKIAPGRAASPIFLGKRETMGESLRAAKFAPYPVGADYISARGHYRRRNPARAHMQCAPTGAPQCPAPTGVYAEHLTYGTFSIIYIIYYIFIYMYCTYVLKMAQSLGNTGFFRVQGRRILAYSRCIAFSRPVKKSTASHAGTRCFSMWD